MQKRLGLILALALSLSGAALAQQAPNYQVQKAQVAPPAGQLKQAEVTDFRGAQTVTPGVAVAANAGWVSSGVTVEAGGQVQITASGRWTLVATGNGQGGPNAEGQSLARSSQGQATGPDGIAELAGRVSTTVPNTNVGALIGRIGDNGAPFLVGSQYSAEVTSTGSLQFSINVSPEVRGNQGSLTVSVTATAPPPPAEEASTVTPPPPGVLPTPEVDDVIVDTTPPDLPPLWMIVAIAIGGVLLLSLLVRAMSPKPDSARARDGVHVPQVTTRVVDSGLDGQTLTLRKR